MVAWPDPNPSVPSDAFALTLHAPARSSSRSPSWADVHGFYVALERFFPNYAPRSARGADVGAAVAEHEPVRRLCLRREPFFDGAINERQHDAEPGVPHVVWNSHR